jgi:hypothetical protein
LRRALGDATARVLYRDDDGVWVDDDGRPAEPVASPGRAMTIVHRSGVPLAAIEHDAWLTTQPDLVDAAVASLGHALESQRLAALARAATDDVRASALRLLGSAERARRSVEHQLDAGPQRALANVAELLEQRPVPFAAVHDGLRTAVAQVRKIAHGIAPASLADDGLAAALDDLTALGAVPAHIGDLPEGPLPLAVGATICAVVRDALEGAAEPLDITIVRIEHEHGALARVRISGWSGPLDQLIDDRVRTFGGTVLTDAATGAIGVDLPLDAE